MSKAIELREKRGKLWEQAKAFLDNAKKDSETLSAENVEKYEKMEADIVALGREIDILERQAALDLELNKPTSAPLTTKPAVNGEIKTGRATDEYRNAFWKGMRGKFSYEVVDALRIGADTEGGFIVPTEFEATLIQGLEEENIIRGLATVIPSSSDKKIPVVASHGTASWVDEEGDIPESDEVFGQITLGAHKLATIIKVSDELLNDAAFNLGAALITA
jgi:HK97 family phage major capsid protein